MKYPERKQITSIGTKSKQNLNRSNIARGVYYGLYFNNTTVILSTQNAPPPQKKKKINKK